MSHIKAVTMFKSHMNKQIKKQLAFLESSEHADRRKFANLKVSDVFKVASTRYGFDWDGKGNALEGYEEKEKEWYTVDQVSSKRSPSACVVSIKVMPDCGAIMAVIRVPQLHQDDSPEVVMVHSSKMDVVPKYYKEGYGFGVSRIWCQKGY